MGQGEYWGDVWAKIRDTGKPVVPDDVFYLRELREERAPSKAHVRRLLRERPAVVPARPDRNPDPDGARARQNYARSFARRLRPDNAQITTPRESIRATRDPVQVKAEAKPLKHLSDPALKARRDHMVAMAKMVYREYNPGDAQILAVWGSHEAWERAKNV
jgi:hypothetical protein